jgi:hypothetical protein
MFLLLIDVHQYLCVEELGIYYSPIVICVYVCVCVHFSSMDFLENLSRLLCSLCPTHCSHAGTKGLSKPRLAMSLTMTLRLVGGVGDEPGENLRRYLNCGRKLAGDLNLDACPGSPAGHTSQKSHAWVG